jgi:hypothetical protein
MLRAPISSHIGTKTLSIARLMKLIVMVMVISTFRNSYPCWLGNKHAQAGYTRQRERVTKTQTKQKNEGY